MAPDRGPAIASEASTPRDSVDYSVELSDTSSSPRRPQKANAGSDDQLDRTRSDHACYGTAITADSPLDGTNFTLRGLVVGTIIGIIICFSNTYFGLQTGWVSGMAMPASLIGFAVFKSMSRFLTLPFTPVENVLVQTVAGAVGMMPLGSGFVGVIPSLQFLLTRDEGAPLDFSLWRLVVWGIGLCLFGVAFGIPLRKQVIIRERLKFPSGTATALMISVLHGSNQEKGKSHEEIQTQGTEEREQLLGNNERGDADNEQQGHDLRADWKRQIKLLLQAFLGSGTYTLLQYFVPILHKLPIFGTYLASTWVWTLNPSPAYVGQGIIMGPATTIHMLLGAIIGWAVLSPVAKNNGWAPGDVNDWETGSKGWIVWVSLAIMLADAVVNLGWLVVRPTFLYGPHYLNLAKQHYQHSQSWKDLLTTPQSYTSLNNADPTNINDPASDEPPDDAPPHHLVSNRTVAWLLPLSMVICVICVHVTFGDYISIPLNTLSLLLSLILAIMGVRALGETDLNPVSGISKLTQLVFAAIAPSQNAVVINLIAGAVSEAGALQAGDILQDLKAGHLIGASPRAQFYGQVIGSLVGAFVSAAVYKLYVSVYPIPGDLFQTPTAYVWIFTARLVTGKGLPPMAWKFAVGFGLLFCCTTALRIYLLQQSDKKKNSASWHRKLHPWIPGGIAVAVGMYNTPSFTLARTVGGLIAGYWVSWKGNSETKVIVLASGLILGEGVMSIVNLVLASLGVPHL